MRVLPADPSIDLLADEDRAFAAWHWLGRASGELESTRAFAWIADSCAAIGTGPEIVAMARRAVDDEERHGAICREVAARYAGADAPPPVSPPSTVPLRTPGDPELAVALYLAEACCLSETIGAVTIEATLKAATSPLAAAALRELLTDEVEHARMGWAYLGAPNLGGRRREAIAEHLPALFQTMLDYWKALGARPTPASVLGHGCLPLDKLESLVLMAFEDVALPGFDHIGIDTRAARVIISTMRDKIPI